jgi:phosphoserine phosphatase
MPATARSAAFFDIDGTLTHTTTLSDFLSSHLTAHGSPDHRTAPRGRLRSRAQAGADRTDRCRAYHRVHAGVEESGLVAEGERRSCERAAVDGVFRPPALAAIRAHAAAGGPTVLVPATPPRSRRTATGSMR